MSAFLVSGLTGTPTQVEEPSALMWTSVARENTAAMRKCQSAPTHRDRISVNAGIDVENVMVSARKK